MLRIRTQLYQIWLWLALVQQLAANDIYMNITSASLDVGALSNCTISLNRSRSEDGTAITPSTIPSPYQIVITFTEEFEFTASTAVDSYSSPTINAE